MGGEYSNELRNEIYQRSCSLNYWNFNCYLTHKKHVLNYFALKMAAIIVAWRRHRRTESVW